MKDNGCLNDDLVVRRNDLLGEMEVILTGEKIHWKLKSQEQMAEGDNSTKFSHKVANGKKMKSLITRMMSKGLRLMM